MSDKQAFVNDTWLDWAFYKNKLSLFMQKQTDLVERNKIWFDILKNCAETSEELFNRFNVLYYNNDDDNYFTLTGVNPDGTEDKFLDIVGYIYGIGRNLVLTTLTGDNSKDDVTLTNYEFLVYIQATIAKTTFDGTTEDLLRIYTGSGTLHYDQYSGVPLEILKEGYHPSYLSSLGIKYVPTANPLTVDVYLTATSTHKDNSGGLTDNLKRLFYDGYFTIESMGIVYSYYTAAQFALGHYMSTSSDTDRGFYDYETVGTPPNTDHIVYQYGEESTSE